MFCLTKKSENLSRKKGEYVANGRPFSGRWAAAGNHAPDLFAGNGIRRITPYGYIATSREVDNEAENIEAQFDAMDEGEFVPDDPQKEVFTESLEASIGYSFLIRQLNGSVRQRITFFISESGDSLSIDDARSAAFKACGNSEKAKELFRQLMSSPVESISFYALAKLSDSAPRAAERLWEMIKAEGRKELESGHFAANAVFPTSQMKNA